MSRYQLYIDGKPALTTRKLDRALDVLDACTGPGAEVFARCLSRGGWIALVKEEGDVTLLGLRPVGEVDAQC